MKLGLISVDLLVVITMSHEANLTQGPQAAETADLHFKTLSKIKIFNSNEGSFDGKTNLLAVSQYYGLVFIGTNNGFIILKSKEVFSATDPEAYCCKEVLTDGKTSHLAIDFEQKHLAIGCQAKMGPTVHVYNISSLFSKGVTNVKTIPFSEPFQFTTKLINEIKWQPNNSSGLTICFSDGSVSCLNLFQGTGNDVFSIPNSAQARCMCWSPKGKQLVIGCSDGTLSQYRPDLKFIKKLVAPPLFNGSVSVVNVLWISSFQFLAAYKDEQKPEEFPIFIIVNAPKNEPVKFINYDDITFSSTFFRTHQLYFYHQPAWNVILVASSNSIEVALLHAKEDNSTWEQWLLGDASRAELPLNNEKLETFPVGIAVDYTSDQIIPWGEDALPPVPRLLLLSSEGLLTTFNFINTMQNTAQLCSPPKENFDDVWFTRKEKNNEQGGLNKMDQAGVNALVTEKPGQMMPPGSAFSPMPFSNQESLLNSSEFPCFKIESPKTQTIFPTQNLISNQKNQQLLLEQSLQVTIQPSSDANTQKKSEKPPITFSFNKTMVNNQNSTEKNNEYFETGEKQNLGLVSNSSAVTGGVSNNSEEEKGNLMDKKNLNETDVKTKGSKGPETSPSRSTPEITPIDDSVYVAALLDEIDHFNSELKHVTSRIAALKIHIGSNEERDNLRKLQEKLQDLIKRLNDITNNQKSEIYTLKIDVFEAFAWLEDARSRNRERKNRTFIVLKKSEDLDPMSDRIMKDISHLKYYIQNQLKQLHLYLMKEWMEHQDNCRLDIKTMMTVPSVEELYKTMHLELKILGKQRLIVEELGQRVKEKTIKARTQTALITNSTENSSKPSDNKGFSELYKLADNLLKIKISSDEQNDLINATDAFQMMIKNQIMEIAERSKKFTSAKQNILRDTFCEREMLKTRSVKSTLASSSFVRNTSSRIRSKYFIDPKKNEIDKAQKLLNAPLAATPGNESPRFLLANSAQLEKNIVNGSSSEIINGTEAVDKEAQQPAETNALLSGNQFNSKIPFVFGSSTTKSESENSNLGVFTFSGSKALNTNSLRDNENEKNAVEKSSPFVFKAPPNLSSVLNSSGKPKSLNSATMFSPGSAQPVIMTAGDSSASNFTFKKTDANFIAPSGSAFSFNTAKNSSAFSPKTSIAFSSSFVESATNKNDVPAMTSEVKTTATTTTSPSTSTFLFSFGGNSAPVPSTESVTDAGAVGNAVSKSNLVNYLNGFAEANLMTEKNAALGASNQEVTLTTKTSTTPVTCKTVTVTSNTVTTPILAASEANEKNLGTTGTIVAPVQESIKTESVAKKPEAKESDEKSADENGDVSTNIVVETPKENDAPEKSESNDGDTSAFPQQSPKPVSGGVSVTNTSFVTTTTTSTVSFGVSGKSIFGQTPVASPTTSSIFSTANSSIFSSEKPVTTRAGLFSSVTEASSSSVFGDANPAAVTTCANVFGQATPTTSSATTQVQQGTGKDELGQATQLFGDMLKIVMPSNDIFGKNNFEKSDTAIFGNAAANRTRKKTSIFGNKLPNIFSKSTFDQISPAPTNNLFGQPQSESNTFFEQNICVNFGSQTNTPQVENPFGSATDFKSRPIFGQSLFGQRNNQQNPFGRSTTNIFGNSTASSSLGENLFPMGSGSFSASTTESFTSGQSTTGGSSLFQKPLAGGFGGSPVFGSGLSTKVAFGSAPTFGGTATFGSPPSFGNPQKVFGSTQGTFGQNQTHTPNFQSLADQSSDGFSNLAQQNQNQAFGGNTFNQNAAFGSETTYGGESFSSWR